MSVKLEGWRTEAFEDKTAFSLKIRDVLYDETSDFQRIEVLDSYAMGRVLLLNGCFMLTEADHFVYHEMLVHPAMRAVPLARHALVIGGGDGGAVTELVKYAGLESVTLCEIDAQVVTVSLDFLPAISAGLSDPRAVKVFDDGAAFLRNADKRFDLILVDSTDPVGPGEALFEPSFFQSVKTALTPGGVAVFQTESPFFMAGVFSAAVKNLRNMFRYVFPYTAIMPCYPGGLWTFCLCADATDPRTVSAGSQSAPPPGLNYYTTEAHHAAFALPAFVERLIREGGP